MFQIPPSGGLGEASIPQHLLNIVSEPNLTCIIEIQFKVLHCTLCFIHLGLMLWTDPSNGRAAALWGQVLPNVLIGCNCPRGVLVPQLVYLACLKRKEMVALHYQHSSNHIVASPYTRPMVQVHTPKTLFK